MAHLAPCLTLTARHGANWWYEVNTVRRLELPPEMELGHWVTGSMGHLSHPGYRVIILTRCETRVFPVFEKTPKSKTYF